MSAVGDVVLKRRVRPLVRYAQTEPIEHAIGVRAPGDCHCRRADRVFKDQVPANDPRGEFAHRCVRICVGAACDRNHRGELGVAQSGKSAADSRDNEREYD